MILRRIYPLLFLIIAFMQAAIYIKANHQFITTSTGNIYIPLFLQHFNDAFTQGHWYPRWSENLFAGTGAPLFVFYPPLAYMIGVLFRFHSATDTFCIYQAGLLMGASLFARSLFYYLWLRRHASAGIAAIICLLLLLEPYNFTQINIQVAPSQLWAIAWFPLALYVVERWRETNHIRFLLCFSVSAALIILTHIPSTLIFLPALWLYGMFYQQPNRKVVIMLSLALLLALGLTAFYWWPAALNHYAVQTDNFYFRFSDQNMAVFFPTSNFITALPLIGLMIGSLWLSRKAPSDPLQYALWSMSALVILSLLLLLPLSQPLWHHLRIMHLLQMPFRFLSLYSALLPLFLLFISRKLRPALWITLTIALALPDMIGAYHTYDQFRHYSEPASKQDMAHAQLALANGPPEYMTLWSTDAVSLDYLTDNYISLPHAKVIQGGGGVSVTRWENEHITLHVLMSNPGSIQVKQHYFPGWQAQRGNSVLTMHPSNLGLIILDVPQGEYDISLKFILVGVHAGLWFSILSAVIWMLICLVAMKAKKPEDLKL